LKGKLTHEFKLPAGQTRTQALYETRQRLQNKLHAYTALIYALHYADSNVPTTILDRLRQGDYDKILLRNDSASEMGPLTNRAYPWGYLPFEDQLHPELRTYMLLPVRRIIPVQAHGFMSSTTDMPRTCNIFHPEHSG
jgi:hypothetical protein